MATNKKPASKSTKTANSKTSTSKTQPAKKVSLGVVIIAVAIIVAVAFAAFMFKDEISTVILSFQNDGTNDGDGNNNKNTNIFTYNPSILGGSQEVTLPSEIQNVGLEIHYIDVEQGDSILIRLPDNKDMLIDAGSGANASAPTAVRTNYFDYLELINVESIDYMIATHPHTDHINMLGYVLDKYEVKNIYYNPSGTTATYNNLVTKINNEPNANIVTFSAGGGTYTIDGEEYLVTIYAPGYGRFPGEDNNMSPIISLEYQENRYLFTGDAEKEVEEWFIEKMGGTSFDCDVLKAGHHGSSSSSSAGFIDFVTPEFAVISVAEVNGYSHPHPSTMNTLFNRGIISYRTNRQGTVILLCTTTGEYYFLVQKEVPPDNNKNRLEERMLHSQSA